MTDEIEIVQLRENLGPDDSRDFVKDVVLPFNKRGHTAEFAFYIDEVLRSQSITLRTTLKF
jgi:hypothetical protein